MTALALRSSPIRTLFARPPTLWFWLLPAITALAAAAYLQVAMDHIDDYTAAAADVGEIRAYAARIEYEALARPAAPSDLSNLIDVARTHTQQAIEQMQSRVTPLLPAPSPEQVMADFNELAGILSCHSRCGSLMTTASWIKQS